MKRKLGINVGCIMGMPQPEQLDMIHSAGFETFFTGSQNDITIGTLKEKAEAYGMTPNAVSLRLYRVRLDLRAHLEERGYRI